MKALLTVARLEGTVDGSQALTKEDASWDIWDAE